MANETLARRYATAVFSLANDANAVELSGRELEMIERTIDADPATADFFVSPVVARGDKEHAFTAAFKGRSERSRSTRCCFWYASVAKRCSTHWSSEYRKLEQAARGVEPLTLTSARELSESEVRAIVEQLERLYSKKFEADVRYDPSLIGGVRIAMGDRVIDGSVAGRLEELTRTLFASGN